MPIVLNGITISGGVTFAAGTFTTAVFAFGGPSTISNLVTNTGILGSDVTNAGISSRRGTGGASYGGDKGIFGFGQLASVSYTNISTLVSNTGVLASNTAGVGTARGRLAACGYGTDTAIFGY